MFCNFCGKNFDTSEGFEEITRAGHHFTRCEKCVYEQREEEYDWSTTMYGRFSNLKFEKPEAVPAHRRRDGRFSNVKLKDRSAAPANGRGGGRFQRPRR